MNVASKGLLFRFALHRRVRLRVQNFFASALAQYDPSGYYRRQRQSAPSEKKTEEPHSVLGDAFGVHLDRIAFLRVRRHDVATVLGDPCRVGKVLVEMIDVSAGPDEYEDLRRKGT